MTASTSHSPPEVVTSLTELAIPVETFATGWQTALSRPLKLRVDTLPVNVDSPKAVSMQIKSRRPQVVSYTFPESPYWQLPAGADPGKPTRPHPAASAQ